MPDGSVPAPDPGTHTVADELVADSERLRQRAVFLRELAEARALLARATPRRTRSARLRARLRQTTFRV
jgi:hypothetical protein